MREDNFIRQSHLRNRFKTAGQTRDELNNIRIGNPIPKITVLRRLKEGVLLSRRPARRIKLNRINAQNRLRWAVNHARYLLVWDNHMFSDESRFLLERRW